jgi:hypothetical protein
MDAGKPHQVEARFPRQQPKESVELRSRTLQLVRVQQQAKREIEPEIAYVVFIDVVGYSKLVQGSNTDGLRFRTVPQSGSESPAH